jgi:predicted nucleotidyltransferase
MKRTQYRILQQMCEALARRLAEKLEKEPAIRFGYLYGSVLDSDTVHDVDVGNIFVSSRAQLAQRLS